MIVKMIRESGKMVMVESIMSDGLNCVVEMKKDFFNKNFKKVKGSPNAITDKPNIYECKTKAGMKFVWWNVNLENADFLYMGAYNDKVGKNTIYKLDAWNRMGEEYKEKFNCTWEQFFKDYKSYKKMLRIDPTLEG